MWVGLDVYTYLIRIPECTSFKASANELEYIEKILIAQHWDWTWESVDMVMTVRNSCAIRGDDDIPQISPWLAM